MIVQKRRALQAEADAEWWDHTFATNKAGRYRIRFHAYIRVRNNRNLNSLQLNLLHPLSATKLRLVHGQNHGHIKELSVEPAAFFEVSAGANVSDVHIRLASSAVIEVKWRVQSGKPVTAKPAESTAETVPEPDNEKESAPLATVSYDALHSVADGILQTSHSFKYSLDSEQSLSAADIFVPGQARVSSVVAHGMQTWHATPSVSAAGPSDENVTGTAVRVIFKSSAITKEAIVMVNTELEYNVTSGFIALPVAICQSVLRQAGTLSVVKVANVEIYEHAADGTTQIRPEDVPSHVRTRTDRPIVLAYRFLSARHGVSLSVIHHEEVGTLQAVGDAALQRILVTGTQTMSTYLIVLQNMHRQYMQLSGLPRGAELWGLKVNSIDAKPVRVQGSDDGTLLVPLLVGFSSDSTAARETSVELAWLTTHADLGDGGRVDLHPLQVDVPVTALLVEVQFPSVYDVNFTGSLEQVRAYSQRVPYPKNYQTGKEVVDKGFDFASAPPPAAAADANTGIRARMPRLGQKLLFEKLFVVNASARLSAAYGPPAPNATEWSWKSLWGQTFR